MTALLPVLLVIVALGVTLYPLIEQRLGSARLGRAGRLTQLRDRYRAALADLQDIELDREVGNLSEADFGVLRVRYRRRAAILLQEIETEQEARERLAREAGLATLSTAGRLQPSAPSRNGAETSFGLSGGLLFGGALAVMASLAVVGLYLRQAQLQAAQAPLANLPIQQARGVTVDRSGFWVAHRDGLLRSEDGRSWRSAGLTGDLTAVLNLPEDGRRLAVGHGTLMASTDGGASWAQVPHDLPGTDVGGAQALDDRAYAYVNGFGVFRSADGVHWQGIGPGVSGSVGSLAVLRADGDVLFVATNGSVARSTDEGRTWAAAAGAGNLALTGFVAAIASEPDRNALYAATDRGLFLSTALGTQWVQLPFRGSALAVGTRGDQVAVVDGQGRFFLSRDGGATWLPD